jgi:hypothetical protein
LVGAWFGHAAVVETLLAHGANRGKPSTAPFLGLCQGATPLMAAAAQGHAAVVALLQPPPPLPFRHGERLGQPLAEPLAEPQAADDKDSHAAESSDSGSEASGASHRALPEPFYAKHGSEEQAPPPPSPFALDGDDSE